MKQAFHFLQSVFLIFALAACSGAADYDYIYLHSITIDGDEAGLEFYDEAREALSQTPLVILNEEGADALTPALRLRTMRIEIELETKSNKVEADVDIENLQTGRDIWEGGGKASLDKEDAYVRALRKSLRRTTEFITQQVK